MSTVTAQILVGTPHQNHGGIQPTHFLYLTENSNPAWILYPTDVFSEPLKEIKRTIWIPSVENMLEDGLLLIAIHVLKHEEICNLANKYFNNKTDDRAFLYEDIKEKDRFELYEKCGEIDNIYKAVLTVLEGSTIMRQLPVLENYKIDVEVCTPKYVRSYSAWTKETRIQGSL